MVEVLNLLELQVNRLFHELSDLLSPLLLLFLQLLPELQGLFLSLIGSIGEILTNLLLGLLELLVKSPRKNPISRDAPVLGVDLWDPTARWHLARFFSLLTSLIRLLL